jgi:diaminopimelate decarboxylase
LDSDAQGALLAIRIANVSLPTDHPSLTVPPPEPLPLQLIFEGRQFPLGGWVTMLPQHLRVPGVPDMADLNPDRPRMRLSVERDLPSPRALVDSLNLPCREDALPHRPVVYISGCNMNDGNPLPGVGVARCIRARFPHAHLVAVDFSEEAGGLADSVFDDALVLDCSAMADPRRHWHDIVALLRADPRALYLPTGDIEVDLLSTFLKTVASPDELEELGHRLLLPNDVALDAAAKPDIEAGQRLGMVVPAWMATQGDISEHDLFAFGLHHSYPVFVKGPDYGAAECSSWGEVKAAIKSMTKLWGEGVYLQESKSGFGMGIMFAACHGELTAAILNRKMTQTSMFKSWAGQLTPVPPDLLEDLRRVVRELNWHGGGEVEFTQGVDGTRYIVDFNPRFPANIFGACHAGVNLPGALVQHLMHLRPDYAAHCFPSLKPGAAAPPPSSVTPLLPLDATRAREADHYYGRTVLEVAWQRTQPILTALPGKTSFSANIKGHPSRIFDVNGMRTALAAVSCMRLQKAAGDMEEEGGRKNTTTRCGGSDSGSDSCGNTSGRATCHSDATEAGIDDDAIVNSRPRTASMSSESSAASSHGNTSGRVCAHTALSSAGDAVTSTGRACAGLGREMTALTEPYNAAIAGNDLGSCSIRWEMGTLISHVIHSVPASCLAPMTAADDEDSDTLEEIDDGNARYASAMVGPAKSCEVIDTHTTGAAVAPALIGAASGGLFANRIADAAQLRCELKRLLPGEHTLGKLANATPRFLMSRASVRSLLTAAQQTITAAAAQAGIPDVMTCLSIKTQPHHIVLEEALKLGFYPEAISSAEARTALHAGFDLQNLVFNGPCKWFDLLAAVHNDKLPRCHTVWGGDGCGSLEDNAAPISAWQEVDLATPNCGQPALTPRIEDIGREAVHDVARVKMIFADSVAELAQIIDMLQSEGHWLAADVLGLRLTPSSVAFSRFGALTSDPATLAHAAEQFKRIPEGTKIGLHFHFAASTVGLPRWRALAMAFVRTASTLAMLSGRDIAVLDFGGGWASHLLDDPAAAAVLTEVFTAARLALPKLQTVAVEPGKCVSERAGALLTRVHHVREFGANRMAVVDASVAELGALPSHPHPVLHLRNGKWRVLPAGGDAIGGRTCMEWDYAHTAVTLPHDVCEGDFILIAFTGAYDVTISYAFGDGSPRAMSEV